MCKPPGCPDVPRRTQGAARRAGVSEESVANGWSDWIDSSKSDGKTNQRRQAADAVIAVGKVAEIKPVVAVFQFGSERDIAVGVANARTGEKPEEETGILPGHGGKKDALVTVVKMLLDALGDCGRNALFVVNAQEARAQAAAKLDAKAS